jgi:hypothetical protein
MRQIVLLAVLLSVYPAGYFTVDKCLAPDNYEVVASYYPVPEWPFCSGQAFGVRQPPKARRLLYS